MENYKNRIWGFKDQSNTQLTFESIFFPFMIDPPPSGNNNGSNDNQVNQMQPSHFAMPEVLLHVIMSPECSFITRAGVNTIKTVAKKQLFENGIQIHIWNDKKPRNMGGPDIAIRKELEQLHPHHRTGSSGDSYVDSVITASDVEVETLRNTAGGDLMLESHGGSSSSSSSTPTIATDERGHYNSLFRRVWNGLKIPLLCCRRTLGCCNSRKRLCCCRKTSLE